jgi:site-specific recombinase XerD
MFGTPAAVRQQCRRGPASFNVHPHLLRHACGFKLANEGHDTLGATALLGHKNIQHTVRYSSRGFCA